MNEVFGSFSFSLGIACVSTESPRFFGLLSLLFVLFVAYQTSKG